MSGAAMSVIRNPLTEEQAVMRTTMTYSLLLNAKRNADCGRFDLKIFEMGKTFIRRGEGEQPVGTEPHGLSHHRPALRRPVAFAGFACGFLRSEGVCRKYAGCASDSRRPHSGPAFMKPSCIRENPVASSAGMRWIGFLGEIHPDLLARLDLTGPIVVCETGSGSPGGPFFRKGAPSAAFPDFHPVRGMWPFLIRREHGGGRGAPAGGRFP